MTTALALGHLGYAHLEHADAAKAIPLLEQAAQRYRELRFHARISVWLAEAYLLSGQVERARSVALQALDASRDLEFRFAVGAAQRALGRVAAAAGAPGEAETHLLDARRTFAAIEVRFEEARTCLDLAGLAHAQGKLEATTAYLGEAHRGFVALRTTHYVAITEERARGFGVSLP